MCGNHPSVAGQVLGNIRLTFVDFDHNGSIALSEITEENNYYPFGLKHKGYNDDYTSNRNAVASKFKYNGKELNDELNLDWYDYGARFYDAALGRWHVIDPLAEKFPWQSTYVYADNNPVRYIDVNGMAAGDPPIGAQLVMGMEHAGMSSTQASETMQRVGMIGLKATAAVVGVAALALTSEIWIPILASGGGKVMTIAELASSSSLSTLIELSIKYPKLYNLIITAIAAESAPPGAIIPGTQLSNWDLLWELKIPEYIEPPFRRKLNHLLNDGFVGQI